MVLEYEYEYENASNEMECLFDAKVGTTEFERLRELADAITEYEKQHCSIQNPFRDALIAFLRGQGVPEKEIPERVRRTLE